MAEVENDDPFAYITELCHISSSQEEVLRHCPFVGETVNLPADDAPPNPNPDGVPAASTDIAMATLTETAQDAGKDRGSQDVFHTPPEQQSSMPTSSDKQRSVDFHHCTVNKMLEIDDETHGFVDFSEYAEAAESVDLSDDSELGFPQVKLEKRDDGVLVAECSRGGNGVGVNEISNCEIDKFRLSKRESSSRENLGESPPKKMKHAEQNPGFESSQACSGIEPHIIGEDAWNREPKMVSNSKSPCNFEAEPQPQQNVQTGKEMCLGKENACGGTPVEKNLGSQSEIARNVEKINLHSTEECDEISESREEIFEAKKLPCTGERNKTVNEVAETSERQKRADEQSELRLLPPSIREPLENAAKGEKEDGKGNNNSFVFDVLKALTEDSEDDDSIDNVSWVELANARGFGLPRPRWKREKDNEKK